MLYVPRVHWDYTREDVLVLERIHGVPIANIEELKRLRHRHEAARRARRRDVLHAGLRRQFLPRRHASGEHLRRRRPIPKSPRYIAIDCAIIGTLTDEDQNYLARNLLAFFNQDYREVARLHLESGWIPEETKVTEFENVIRRVCEPIFEKPLKEISFGHFLVTLFQTAREFNMEVQPQLVLLQKTLLNIEGLGRQLYPDLDLWHTAKPFMERWMEQRMGPAAMLAAVQRVRARNDRTAAAAARTDHRRESGAAQARQNCAGAARGDESACNADRRSATKGRGRRWLGATLLVVSGAFLWAPVAHALQTGQPMPITVGVLAAVLGSMLIAKA